MSEEQPIHVNVWRGIHPLEMFNNSMIDSLGVCIGVEKECAYGAKPRQIIQNHCC